MVNNLSKAILNGDFDESSSSDDDIIMMQLFTAQQQRLQMLSLNQQTRRVSSTSGRRYINRESVKGDEQIYRDYFADNPVYPEEYFRRRFRMRRSLSIVATYEAVYLRSPNEADVARLLQEGEQRGFPGMSPLFAELTRGRAPAANYTINNHAYTMGCYLTDGIYPRWATIVKTISQPQGAKRQLFARMQEACLKDVERAFGVLQARFNIISVPARSWSDEDLYYIMKKCIILHNMIIEDERDIPENERSAAQLETDTSNLGCQVSRNPNEEYAQFMLN
ncbi:uncharacterized protein LOC114319867 [Camellia sinensis]|uniref:uncharacterized protein LOC114319867 n=1 Tax=Camellia sinensis TaxID=4442 RepID=UPI00103680B4|nr:uncharacterized protein LOC114319867 [Camellia sinensis]